MSRANELYAGLFELRVGMDLGWVGSLAPSETPGVQLQVIVDDATFRDPDGNILTVVANL